MMEITKEGFTEAIRIIVDEVLNQRENVIQKEFDLRHHDVKLLMKNYRMLKAHYAHISPETLWKLVPFVQCAVKKL